MQKNILQNYGKISERELASVKTQSRLPPSSLHVHVQISLDFSHTAVTYTVSAVFATSYPLYSPASVSVVTGGAGTHRVIVRVAVPRTF